MHDYTKSDLDPMTKGMLDFALKLTRAPRSIQMADVEAPRALGLTDEQILSVVLITYTFNFMTRLADSLGVEVDSNRQKAVERWLTGPALQQDWLMKAKFKKGWVIKLGPVQQPFH